MQATSPLAFEKVHVLAGAHVDMVATFAATPIMATSNPATFAFMAGGGGLNIASAIAALDVPVRIVAPVGADANGELLRQTCSSRKIEAELIESSRHPTGIYAGLFTPEGELTVGAADVRQQDGIRAGKQCLWHGRFVRKNVQTCATDHIALEGGDERQFVNDGAARNIDDSSLCTQRYQDLCIHQVMRRRAARATDDQKVALGGER